MAIAIHGCFMSASDRSDSRKGDDADGLGFKLPRGHADDLRDVARGVEESNVGIATRYLIDTMSGAGRSNDIDDDGYVNSLHAVESFCDRFGVWRHPAVQTWRRRIERCRRALARMQKAGQHVHVATLHIVHGYPDPFARHFPELDAFGAVAGLVRYTSTVEAHRQLLVKSERARYERERVLVDADVDEDDDKMSADVREAREVLRSLDRTRAAQRFAESVTTSADALRDLLAPLPKSATKAEHSARVVTLSTLKLEATRMLCDAERAYHAAWLASGARL